MFCLFFFFQAEDGIRDKLVTGVQTCALPISALVWLKFVVNPAMARVRLAVGLIRADQALLPPLAGVAHVPSPRQNVVADAPVPLPRLVMPRFPVTPPLPLAARLIAGISAPTRARKVGAAAPPLEGPLKTVFALWLANAPVNVPEVVTGEPVTLKIAGSAKPILVTVPPPAPAAPMSNGYKKVLTSGPAVLEPGTAAPPVTRELLVKPPIKVEQALPVGVDKTVLLSAAPPPLQVVELNVCSVSVPAAPPTAEI